MAIPIDSLSAYKTKAMDTFRIIVPTRIIQNVDRPIQNTHKKSELESLTIPQCMRQLGSLS